MHLYTGDIIKFDELIFGQRAFGYDYTAKEVLNGQIIYPQFFITEVRKSRGKVNVKAIRLHHLERTFEATLGDVSRRGSKMNLGESGIFEAPTVPPYATLALMNFPDRLDEALINDYCADKTRRYTTEQLANMDINNSNGITWKDSILLSEFIEFAEEQLQDLDFDEA